MQEDSVMFMYICLFLVLFCRNTCFFLYTGVGQKKCANGPTQSVIFAPNFIWNGGFPVCKLGR